MVAAVSSALGVIGAKVATKCERRLVMAEKRVTIRYRGSGAELQPVPVEKAMSVPLDCSKCGAKNNPDAKFCQNCGGALSETKH